MSGHPRDRKSAEGLLSAFLRPTNPPTNGGGGVMVSGASVPSLYAEAAAGGTDGQRKRPHPTSHRDLKPIPLADEAGPSRLDGWERVAVGSWGMEEVIAWAMAVARRHGVPPEDLSLHRFASLNGRELLDLNRHQLEEMSPGLGGELFQDLLRLHTMETAPLSQSQSSMPTLLLPRVPVRGSPERPAAQAVLGLPLAPSGPPRHLALFHDAFDPSQQLQVSVAGLPTRLGQTGGQQASPSQLLAYLTNLTNRLPHQGPSFLDSFFPTSNGPSSSPPPPLEAGRLMSPMTPLSPTSSTPGPSGRNSEAKCGGSGGRAAVGAGCSLQPPEDRKPTLDELLAAAEQTRAGCSRKAQLLNRWERETSSPELASQAAAINSSIFGHLAPAAVSQEYQRALQRAAAAPIPDPVPLPLQGDDEAKGESPDSLDAEEQTFRANFPPRNKRAHGKKHVLWQFILHCLGDPAACPSVVRWEDRARGIFRIVSSTDLAKLWGQRKNRNSSMSYEKLSRAMRAYYKEGILFPGPRSGRYPKKLVYQFGPNAAGWQDVANGRNTANSPIPIQ